LCDRAAQIVHGAPDGDDALCLVFVFTHQGTDMLLTIPTQQTQVQQGERSGEDALLINWCEVRIIHAHTTGELELGSFADDEGYKRMAFKVVANTYRILSGGSQARA
jgi:hypothetical protein